MINKIKTIISNSFEEDIDVTDLNLKFQDYEGWDSLTAMVLIDRLSEELNFEVEVDDISEMSVSDILNKL